MLFQHFNPRSPWGERPTQSATISAASDFNPRSPWGERRCSRWLRCWCRYISIHAPRGGSDPTVPQAVQALSDFNPRSPWGERRWLAAFVAQLGEFQSTLPVGGATIGSDLSLQLFDFNPRSPWGERPAMLPRAAAGPRDFNPRSPWGERHNLSLLLARSYHFNPRSPWGERRRTAGSWTLPHFISIHAPRGGSDADWPGVRSGWRDFNPRSPWGERPGYSRRLDSQANFNPRSPWGERPCLPCSPSWALYFNPRSPWGERPVCASSERVQRSISIHAPRGGSDLPVPYLILWEKIFQSTLPVGGATRSHAQRSQQRCHFNPRSPWGERPP